jgi:hypothetical protein
MTLFLSDVVLLSISNRFSVLGITDLRTSKGIYKSTSQLSLVVVLVAKRLASSIDSVLDLDIRPAAVHV